jgi:hypothetical protein
MKLVDVLNIIYTINDESELRQKQQSKTKKNKHFKKKWDWIEKKKLDEKTFKWKMFEKRKIEEKQFERRYFE